MNYNNSEDINQYYPTPPELIEKMLEPYKSTNPDVVKSQPYTKLYQKRILEPSAGKGAILKYIQSKDIRYYGKFDVCEIDHEYHKELNNLKSCRLVGVNFLSYSPDVYYDYIFMNPPFNNGVKHLLHAYHMSEGAEIVCLLNAETIRNPYSEERKLLLKIIEDNNGSIEFIDSSFSDAERSTDIEIALIRLKKSISLFNINIDFNHTAEKEENIDFNNLNELMTSDIFTNNEIAFNRTKEALKKFVIVKKELEYYMGMLLDKATTSSKQREWMEENNGSFKNEVSHIFDEMDGLDSPKEIYSKILMIIKQSAWERITRIPKIESMLTRTSKQALELLISEHKYLPYTRENMMNIYIAILRALPDIRKQAIVDAFDWLTSYHKDNRIHPEGWKTNSSWKVNMRCILPGAIRPKWHENSADKIEVTYETQQRIRELEQALLRLTKDNISDDVLDSMLPVRVLRNVPIYDHKILSINSYCFSKPLIFTKSEVESGKILKHSLYSLNHYVPMESVNYVVSGNKYESKFFIVKFYKKGTIHLEFKDKKLHDLFNYIACHDKKWLPDIDKKEYAKKYKDDSSVPVWIKTDMDIQIEDKTTVNKTLEIENKIPVKEYGNLF